MTQSESSTDERPTDGITRRGFVTGLGAVSFAGVGVTTGRARTPNEAVSDTPSSVGRTFADRDELETFVDDLMSERIGDTVPGATVAIVEGDTPVLTKGYGYADAENEVPVRADGTAFRIGSVGKLLTWTTVMQGVERQTLDLDEDVNAYLDDSPVEIPDTYADPVTLRHLGTHTAGFESALDPGIVSTPRDLVSIETALVEDQPERVRPPGEAVGYSNYGAMLAGHVVAEAHDATFDAYVQSELLEPLGMEHTTFAQPVPDDHPGELASPHERTDGRFAVPDPIYINFRPAGATSATATDMARFMSAHLGDGSIDDVGILDADAIARMHSQQYERHPEVNNWRYGFYEYGHPGSNLFGHSGGTIYFTSLLVLAPDHDVGIFVNYNIDGDPSAVVDEIIAEYDLQSDAPTPTSTAKSGSRERAKQVAGEYGPTMVPQNGPIQVIGRMAHITVEPVDDAHIVTETIDGQRRWVETSPYVYREVDGTDVAAFEVEHGEATALHLNSNPQGSYTPVERFEEQQFVTGGVVGSSLAVFAGSIVGWSGLGLVRYVNRRRNGTENSSYEPAAASPRETTGDDDAVEESE